jgi:hypothetical protein
MKKIHACLMVVTLIAQANLLAENVTASSDTANANNLLKNPSFELGRAEHGRPPDDWGFITESAQPVNGGMTQTAAHSGDYSVSLGKPQNPKDKWQVLAFNTTVDSGSVYEFSAWVRPDAQNPLRGDTKGTVSIEWKDIDGNELERSASEPWNSKTFAGSGDWKQFKIKAPAPKGAASATFVITYYAGNPNEMSGSFLVDDVAVTKVSP